MYFARLIVTVHLYCMLDRIDKLHIAKYLFGCMRISDLFIGYLEPFGAQTRRNPLRSVWNNSFSMYVSTKTHLTNITRHDIVTNEPHKFAFTVTRFRSIVKSFRYSSNGIDFAPARVPFPVQISLFAPDRLVYGNAARAISRGLPLVFFVIPAWHSARKLNFDWHARDIRGINNVEGVYAYICRRFDQRALKILDVS